jgi:hypothetical protein
MAALPRYGLLGDLLLQGDWTTEPDLPLIYVSEQAVQPEFTADGRLVLQTDWTTEPDLPSIPSSTGFSDPPTPQSLSPAETPPGPAAPAASP